VTECALMNMSIHCIVITLIVHVVEKNHGVNVQKDNKFYQPTYNAIMAERVA
jgi:hypothetical protein